MPPHPTQPIVLDEHGVERFQGNAIVKHLLEIAGQHGVDLNRIAAMDFALEDRVQFAQLLGYSVSGLGDLVAMQAVDVASQDNDRPGHFE